MVIVCLKVYLDDLPGPMHSVWIVPGFRILLRMNLERIIKASRHANGAGPVLRLRHGVAAEQREWIGIDLSKAADLVIGWPRPWNLRQDESGADYVPDCALRQFQKRAVWAARAIAPDGVIGCNPATMHVPVTRRAHCQTAAWRIPPLESTRSQWGDGEPNLTGKQNPVRSGQDIQEITFSRMSPDEI